MTQFHAIYPFSKGYTPWLEDKEKNTPKEAKRILGGKGASLVSMIEAGLPVPPGFTITTQVCNEYRKVTGEEREKFLTPLWNSVDLEFQELHAVYGKLTDLAPLVSVRSGAPISMPGMMDTILNVGITTETLPLWVKKIGERPAWDSYRRLIQMLGATAYGVPSEEFEALLTKYRKTAKVEQDSELPAEALMALVIEFKKLFQAVTQKTFPDTLAEQLRAAILAVFDSWMNPRAIEYRKINGISEDMGTAVTVQCMVFGNMGESSGSGVLFTRNPSTGLPIIMGEYLANAQGEDVVAGIRTPTPLGQVPNGVKVGKKMVDQTKWKKELAQVCIDLEKYYRDMVDVEFTVQEGTLYILQSRSGKRSAAAAVKIAMDMLDEGVLTPKEALQRITAEQYKIASRPGIDPKYKTPAAFTGLPACPGVAVGVPVFSSADAVASKVPCILVTHETTPDDIAGMNKAVGILTKTGGATSHAAVVARAMDKPCVVGCTELDLNSPALITAERITVDGATGRVWVNHEVPVIDTSATPEMLKLVALAHEQFASVREVDVPDEADWGLPMVIRSHGWWGDREAFDVILEEMLEFEGGLYETVLDIRPPASLMQEEDMGLLRVHSANETEPFIKYMFDKLKSVTGDLKGLIIVTDTTGPLMQVLEGTLNCVFTRKAVTVADIMFGKAVDVTPTFIQSVIGGDEAWAKLQALLKSTGVEALAIPRGAPDDYAVFQALHACAS